MSTANTDRPHKRWTCQLLRGSILLPRPSTLHEARQPTASVESISPPRARPRQWGHALWLQKGGRNRERHPAYKPPPAICTKVKIAKGGAYLRPLRYLYVENYSEKAQTTVDFSEDWCFSDSHFTLLAPTGDNAGALFLVRRTRLQERATSRRTRLQERAT